MPTPETLTVVLDAEVPTVPVINTSPNATPALSETGSHGYSRRVGQPSFTARPSTATHPYHPCCSNRWGWTRPDPIKKWVMGRFVARHAPRNDRGRQVLHLQWISLSPKVLAYSSRARANSLLQSVHNMTKRSA